MAASAQADAFYVAVNIATVVQLGQGFDWAARHAIVIGVA
jgi:hypothetical protein